MDEIIIKCSNSTIDAQELKRLIQNKANINSIDSGKKTPLHLVCINKLDFQLVKIMIENKADLNMRDKELNIPFHYACLNSKITLEIVEILIKNKSNINLSGGYGYSPLQIICFNKNPNVNNSFSLKFVFLIQKKKRSRLSIFF